MIAACITNKGSLGGGGALPTPPVANFVCSDTDSWVGGNVGFTDLSTGGPTAWEWSYAGGVFSNLQNPSFYFATPGTYLFYLRASNAFGSSSYGPVTVYVSALPPP